MKVEIPLAKTAKNVLQAQQAVALRRANNLEHLVQQNIRQGRPAVRAELIFVRNVCALKVDELRRINQDVEKALKDAARKWAENPLVRKLANRANGPTGLSTDLHSALQQELALVMKKNLGSAQFSRYEAELEKRNANRRQSALHFLVDAIDRELYLSDQQRMQLTESLTSHWDDSWCTSLEYLLYGNQFYPLGIDPYVIPVLDDTQKRVWQGTQKVGGPGGFGIIMGNFVNDNDALEEELGEPRKIAPADEVAIPVQLPNRPIGIKKAMIKDALEKK